MGERGAGAMNPKAERSGTDPQAELSAARRRLLDAYEAARAVDYLPGSSEMGELAAAEDHYQRARCRRDREVR